MEHKLIEKKFEEIIDLAQLLQDKVMELGFLINKKPSGNDSPEESL